MTRDLWKARPLALVASVAATALLAACGGGGSDSSDSGGGGGGGGGSGYFGGLTAASTTSGVQTGNGSITISGNQSCYGHGNASKYKTLQTGRKPEPENF